MKKYLTPLSATFLLCTTAAFAQGTDFQGGELTLEYNSYDSDVLPNPATLMSANFGAAYNITPKFGLQLGAGYNSLGLDIGGADLSLDMTDINAHAYYNISDDSKVGVFVTQFAVGELTIEVGGNVVDMFPTSMNILAYGLEGTYGSGPFSVEARYGMADVADSLILGPLASELDISFYNLDVEYAISPDLTVLAGANGTSLTVFGDGITLANYTVGVDYQAVPNLTLNAGVNAGSISITGASDTIDMFGYSLGATYVVPSAALGNNEVTVFASYGSTNFSGPGMDQDVDHIKVGATIAFGGPSSSDLFSRVSLF